jgi:hypothetical protein
MNWNKVFSKKRKRSQKKSIYAYEVDRLLNRYPLEPVEEILKAEDRRNIATAIAIREQGIDEKNRLKAVIKMHEWVHPPTQKHQIEGNLDLSARLNEVLEPEEKE